MNTDDATELLAYAASFDNRKPSKAQATAFAEALGDVPLDADCRSAIATYYGSAGNLGASRWLQPHHVRTIRNSIRADRIEQAHALYEGQPTEGPAEFIERRRAQLTAAANGQLPQQPIRYALNGPPHPSIADALGAAVRYVPDEARADLAAAIPGWAARAAQPELAIPCPVDLCRARPGRRCIRPSSKAERKTSHAARLDTWATRQTQTEPQHHTA